MSAARRPPRYWFDGSAPPAIAHALASLYGAAIGVRVALYRRGWLRSGHPVVPVVVVGNLIAGGSGKTPMTIAVVERLRAAGWKPGVASRGYGRRDAATPRWVQRDTDPAEGGDEPVLIALRSGAPVRVDRDRLAAARALVAEGCDIVVCDDGLQHYRLARDVEIEVIDGRRRYGNGRLLPAGPLREPESRAANCDFRVANFGTAAPATSESAPSEPGFGEWPMRLAVADAQALRGARHMPLSAFAGQRVHAVAGIGDPERFFETLRGAGIAVVPHAFPDHHRYVADDLRFGSDLPVLMTEKDAVKCTAFAEDGQYCVAIRAELPEAFWVAFLDRIKQTVEKQTAQKQAAQKQAAETQR